VNSHSIKSGILIDELASAPNHKSNEVVSLSSPHRFLFNLAINEIY